ncbi:MULTISPECIES: thioredoxin family protein [Pacificibacter]|uniref:thioredoxin family protein n=1 Tax=Pacificibacter TaxID=1042323 RepID=UPI001C08F914|nr:MULTISPECIES: thioredoxin family protein [Pacificibacter]MBU2935324.1 thioredoxin family protein [Pacificibacter marinus]MDO6615478.1 thioredoxin family protein [Pacificibacter sp. 1_MG-2023]
MFHISRRTFGALALGFACTLTPAFAAVLGDDGLHKAPWLRETFKDLREDLEEATAEGKRLMVMIEQRGCIYCTKMHEEVFPDPDVTQMIEDNFFVVQINMFGDVEVTDFDGEVLSEKDMVQKWRALFTPTTFFFPQEVPEGLSAPEAAVSTVPGAFGRMTTYNMMTWVLEQGYDTDVPFQKYHADRVAKQQKTGTLRLDAQ